MRSTLVRRPCVLLVVLASALLHCGGSSDTPFGGATDGGGDGGPDSASSADGAVTNPPGCPSTTPGVGTPCASEGLQCSYGACGVTRRACVSGTWQDRSGGGAPGPGACPTTVPKDGTACDTCALPSSCSYPCTGGASVPTEASCPSGQWQVRQGLGPCTGGGSCSPTCTNGNLCCEEPTHRVNDAGMPETAWTCVQPTSSGGCPALP